MGYLITSMGKKSDTFTPPSISKCNLVQIPMHFKTIVSYKVCPGLFRPGGGMSSNDVNDNVHRIQ